MKIKKILVSILLIIIIMTNMPIGCVKALTDNQTIKLIKDHDCTSLLKIKGKDLMKGIAYVYYKDETENKYPAFCVEPKKEGIGTGAATEYDATVNKLNNDILWRMLYKGYMGTNYTDWNLECDDDLYYATKTAIHSMADTEESIQNGGAPISPKEKYEVAQRVGWGENVSLEEVQRRSSKVLEVAQEIYDYGYNGIESYVKPQISISKKDLLKEEIINNEEYLVQYYNVISNKNLSSYEVSISNFPKGTMILDLNNLEKNIMTDLVFKIVIPKNQIINNISGTINIENAQIKTYPIFYADSNNEKTQNYVTYTVGYETANTNTNLNIDAYMSKIVIIKTDKETGKVLPGVTFNAQYENGENIGNFITDVNGKIEITKLRQGKVILTEIETNEDYILDDTKTEVNLDYNDTKTVNITNIHKKGNLKIIKVDSENELITMGAVEFDLLDSYGKIITHLVTDVNGEAEAKDINTGNYILRETKTKKEYSLGLDQDVTIEWNQTSELIVKNERKRGQIKIIKYDADDNEIRLEGVKFEIIDKFGNVIETITTDEKGEALSSRLTIGEYKIKEVELGKNEDYILNEEERIIEVEENKIKAIEFKNKLKKGNLKIVKVDSENEETKLSEVEFELYNENNELINILITNEEGEAYFENLKIGKYRLKEIKTNEDYVLNEEEIEFTIEWNKEILLEIKNEKIKGQIQIIKTSQDDNLITGEKAGNPIPNVEFEIKNEKGEVIEKVITNSEGMGLSNKLEKGKYTIKETKANENYILDETEYTAEIKENGEVVILNIKNKSKMKLPRTGF